MAQSLPQNQWMEPLRTAILSYDGGWIYSNDGETDLLIVFEIPERLVTFSSFMTSIKHRRLPDRFLRPFPTRVLSLDAQA